MTALQIIKHRVNSMKQLDMLPFYMGAEIDIRYHCNELILHHDPFNHHRDNPCNFENFLKKWKHDGVLILNVKTEGIEEKCIELMQKYEVKRWFFLDLSMPYFVKYTKIASDQIFAGFGTDNLAVRYSEREPIEYALAFSGKAGWVWIDSFEYLNFDKEIASKLKSLGFKLCLVSPELQGHGIDKIKMYKDMVATIQLDAVCTKFPEKWSR